MDVDKIIQDAEKLQNANVDVSVTISARDEEKSEPYSIEVGPADFRTKLTFSDFNDLRSKLNGFKTELEYARENGIAARPKAK